MGSFFTNLHVRSDSRDAVADTLQTIVREPTYLTSPRNGWVSVFPEETEPQGDDLMRIGAAVSRQLQTAVICFLVHDSDIFCYWLFHSGAQLDEYNSNPDYFEPAQNAKALRGVPETLLQIALPGVTVEQITKTLHTEKLFAEDIVGDFAVLLGIDEMVATVGYKYLGEGLEDGDFDAGEVIRLEVGAQKQDYLNKKLREASPWRDLVKLQELIDAGADVTAPMQDGFPMLATLARYCMTDAMEILIASGADVNIRCSIRLGWDQSEVEDGYTPVMAVCNASCEHPTSQIETVRLLLDSGADVHAQTSKGRTALDFATDLLDWRKHQGRIGRHAPEDVLKAAAERMAEIVRMLREAGAR